MGIGVRLGVSNCNAVPFRALDLCAVWKSEALGMEPALDGVASSMECMGLVAPNGVC